MSVTRHLLASVNDQPVRISLSWDSRSPFTVRMTVHISGQKTPPWEFAWDLLEDGLLTPTGIGDVHVYPHRPGCTGIVLMPGLGQAVLLLPTREVEAFLADTWCAEPPPVTDDELAELIERWATDGVS